MSIFIPRINSESRYNLLNHKGLDFTKISERPLIYNEKLADFDSPMRRFESSRPSQAMRLDAVSAQPTSEKPANGGLSQFGSRSPDSQFGYLWTENGEVSGHSLKNSVFRRLRPETGFDLHCAAELAVLSSNSPIGSLELHTKERYDMWQRSREKRFGLQHQTARRAT
jgi:hypothetical protein